MSATPRRFRCWFYRYNERDWVIQIGRRQYLTRELHFGTIARTQIRRRQPRAIVTGRARIRYSRRLTVIEAA